MFSCAVRTPPEHMWRSNTKQRHNVEMMLIVPLFNIRHNSYFFSRYYCAKSNIKCPKIVKNTLIIDIFTGLHGFLSICSAIYLLHYCTYPLIAHLISQLLSLMAAEDGAACHNQEPTSPIDVGIV